MRKSLLILVLSAITCAGISQKILVVENNHSLRNIKYHEGDGLMIKIDDAGRMVKDVIFCFTDSAVVLERSGEVSLDRITAIYRENWLIQTVRGLSLLGGVAYFGIDSFNRFINHEYPVVDAGTMAISAGMVAAAFALTPLKYRKINTRKNWSLRIIDPNAY